MPNFTRNTWTSINTDLSKSKQNQTYLLDALNIRIITDGGLSTGAITNRKGNKYSFKIPSYPGFTTTSQIEHNSTNNTIVLRFPPDSILPYIIGTTITITRQDGNTFSGIVVNITIPPVSSYVYIYTTISSLNFTDYLSFYPISSNAYLSFTDNGGNQVIIPQIDSWEIVKITNIRQDIIILAVGLGIDNIYYTSIWKCRYNEETEIIENSLPDGSLTFGAHEVYTRAMNMLPTNSIDIQVHYENSTTGRIYWTDFKNPMRSFNVLLPAIQFGSDYVPVDTIDIVPYFKGDIPILKNIFTGGNIPVGSIQIAYRLLSDDGGLTNFSHPSNLIQLSSHSLSESYQTYQGDSQGVNSGKSIEFNINNIDSNYKFIQFSIITYQFKDVPSITILPLKQIPTDGNFIYSGSEEGETTLTRQEFVAISNPFLTVKGIEQYKNILLPYNTQNPTLEITDEEFDARAYRFLNVDPTVSLVYNTFNPIDGGTGVLQVQPTNPDTSTSVWDIPFIHSAININQDNFKYKYNTTTLGGTGKFISYEFITEKTILDINKGSSSSLPPFVSVSNNITTDKSLSIDNQTYPTNNSYADSYQNTAIKSTYSSSLFKGYASEETYRMGIQFFDKRMNPFFVKWIGDIKFPKRTETGFNLTEELGFAPEIVVANQIGIKFTINIPDSLRDRISGFSIVKVERQQKDKTRLGMGILHRNTHVQHTIGTDDILCNPFQDNDGISNNGNGHSTTDPPTSDSGADINLYGFTSEIPNFLFGLNTTWQQGDYLSIIHRYSCSSTVDIKNSSGTNIGKYKKYEIKDVFTDSNNYLITYRKSIAPFETIISSPLNLIPSGRRFINMGNDEENVKPYKEGAIGCFSEFIQLNNANSIQTNNDILDDAKPVISYNRNISNQYGGNTFSDRTSNTYISCSDFIPISTFVNNTPFKVFGGDVYVCLYDVKKLEHNYPGENSGFIESILQDSDTRIGITFPCEVSFNLNLRQGHHFAKDSFSIDFVFDQYIYNTAYSQENNLRQFFPKPLETTNLSTGSANETSCRVWASDKKINGEQIDSFKRFKPLNFIDVQGNYGQINRVIVHNNNVIYYQDRAIGVLAIEYRSLTQDSSGASLSLGTGKVLERFDYLSTETGSIHQWGVILSREQLYHYDAYNKKIYILSGQQNLSISDSLGIASLLRNKVDNKLRNQTKSVHNNTFTGDKPLETLGITTAFEQEQNTIHFTFISPIPQFSIPNSEIEKFTLSYNETLKGWESRQNFNSPVYHSTEGRILSINPLDKSKVYIQNRGIGEIYDVTYPLYFKFLINPAPESTKVLDNLIFQLETIDSNGIQINEPFSQIRITNDYQDTGLINIIPYPLPSYNIRRKERTWHFTVLRDVNLDPTSSIKPRIRDKYFIVEIWFNNNNNKQIKIHDVISVFRNSIT